MSDQFAISLGISEEGGGDVFLADGGTGDVLIYDDPKVAAREAAEFLRDHGNAVPGSQPEVVRVEVDGRQVEAIRGRK